MDWSHVASGALAALVAIAAIRRWRSHTRGRDVHIEWRLDWHARQRDDSKEATEDDRNDDPR